MDSSALDSLCFDFLVRTCESDLLSLDLVQCNLRCKLDRFIIRTLRFCSGDFSNNLTPLNCLTTENQKRAQNALQIIVSISAFYAKNDPVPSGPISWVKRCLLCKADPLLFINKWGRFEPLLKSTYNGSRGFRLPVYYHNKLPFLCIFFYLI